MNRKMIMGAALALLAAGSSAHAELEITEYMYKGLFGEFIELTNTDSGIVDLASGTGYRFQDSSGNYGNGVALNIFADNTLTQNESVIITEVDAAIFRRAWFVLPGVSEPGGTGNLRIVENNIQNLGRSDSLRIFNGAGSPVQAFTFNDEATPTPNGPRTEDLSGIQGPSYNPTDTTAVNWVLSASNEDGDNLVSGSWKAGAVGATGPYGSPGVWVVKP
jgi:hypothetical protein